MNKNKTPERLHKGDKPSSIDLANPVKVVWEPIKHFMLTDNAAGLTLLAATVLALIWANINAQGYEHLWNTQAAIQIGSHKLELSLRDWINDGLMTIFFLMVGLEIKRELLVGELSSFRQAILPVVAAAGGMLVPALIYTFFAGHTPMANGWGIPVATDIAFALGVLSLCGKSVPKSLKVFLVALAIADDLGAVLVIAFFYTTQLNVTALVAAALIFALLLLSNKMGVRSLVWYLCCGLFLWFAVHASGIHSTIAGVLLAIAIPSWTRLDLEYFKKCLHTAYHDLRPLEHPDDGILADKRILESIVDLNLSTRRIQPPMFTLEHSLGVPVSFLIMPLFALANSGVAIGNIDATIFSDSLAHGIYFGLLCGKPIGIVCATWLIVKLGLSPMPRNSDWAHVWGVGILGGIGFTMSLFVTGLSGVDSSHMDIARLSILAASSSAGILGFTVLRLLKPVPGSDEEDKDTSEPPQSEATPSVDVP